MSRLPLVVLGDSLLDRDVSGRADRLCPDAPVPVVEREEEHVRPGGAALAALLAASDGRRVILVTALGRDEAGSRVAALLADAAVEVVDLGTSASTAEKTRIITGGRCMLRLDAGGSTSEPGPWTRAAQGALVSAGAVLVADYGRGVAASPAVRGALAELPPRLATVWDPHPRGPAPVPGVRLVTPNGTEATLLAPEIGGAAIADDARRARALRRRWEAAGVAVTLGSRGALLVEGDGPPLAVPAVAAKGDTCGAGDRFSSAAAGLLADGALPSEAVTGAVRMASAFVAAGGAAAVAAGVSDGPRGTDASRDPFEVVRRVRDGGGTVVAAGGCFDLLHAGHVSMLRSARALGDCLVVCLNSDDSVQRLKGADRPLVPEGDRAGVLRELECVDAVAVFEEDTPLALLDRLRPDVFVKGADYSLGDLPERSLLSGWGGEVVVVPFLEGRSTTGMVNRLARAGPD